MLRWLIFFHVLAAVTFFLTHGAAAAMPFRLRSETDLIRIRAILDLSLSTFPVYALSFTLMVLSGVVLAFLASAWDQVWTWLSLSLTVGSAVYMGLFDEKTYKRLRKLVGQPYMQGFSEYPAEAPASEAVVAQHVKSIRVASLVVTGYVIPAFVLWLMIFKPS